MTTSPLFKRVPAEATATWAGDEDILNPGSPVEILKTDTDDPSVPARRACWIRHWPENREYPVYRSCDLSDLENFSRAQVAAAPEPPAEELTISEIEILALKKLALVSRTLGQSLRARSAAKEQLALTQVLADVISRAELARAPAKGNG